MKNNKHFISIVLVMVLLMTLTACASEKKNDTAIFNDLYISSEDIYVDKVSKDMTPDELISSVDLKEDEILEYSLQGTANESVIMTKQENAFKFDETGDGMAVNSYNFEDNKLYSVTYAVNYKDSPFDDSYTTVKNVFELVCERMGDAKYIEEGSLENTTQPGSQFQRKWTVGDKSLAFIVNYQDMSDAQFETGDVLWLNIIADL